MNRECPRNQSVAAYAARSRRLARRALMIRIASASPLLLNVYATMSMCPLADWPSRRNRDAAAECCRPDHRALRDPGRPSRRPERDQLDRVDGASNRTVNMDVGALRRVQNLAARSTCGRARITASQRATRPSPPGLQKMPNETVIDGAH